LPLVCRGAGFFDSSQFGRSPRLTLFSVIMYVRSSGLAPLVTTRKDQAFRPCPPRSRVVWYTRLFFVRLSFPPWGDQLFGCFPFYIGFSVSPKKKSIHPQSLQLRRRDRAFYFSFPVRLKCVRLSSFSVSTKLCTASCLRVDFSRGSCIFLKSSIERSLSFSPLSVFLPRGTAFPDPPSTTRTQRGFSMTLFFLFRSFGWQRGVSSSNGSTICFFDNPSGLIALFFARESSVFGSVRWEGQRFFQLSRLRRGFPSYTLQLFGFFRFPPMPF